MKRSRFNEAGTNWSRIVVCPLGVLLNGYNAAFQNYWHYQSLGNVNDAEEFDDPDLLLL